jgi:hypothetical protein
MYLSLQTIKHLLHHKQEQYRRLPIFKLNIRYFIIIIIIIIIININIIKITL